jgi:dynein heavy chain
VWDLLAETYRNRGQDTMLDTLNPKAVTSNELFGALSKSKEWKDGVLSVIMRNQYKNLDKNKPSLVLKWVILDGDIDPESIESLNTVMDDNKILTLFSNERVPLSNFMRLLFEISNLRNATPATVSRGGVLFINGTDVGVRPYYES